MLSLKVQTALHIITAKYTFEELLKLLDNPITQEDVVLSQVANDGDFWRAITINYYGRIKVDRRLDILPENWKAHAMASYLNYVSIYTLVTPIDASSGALVLRYHGAEDDPSKGDIARAFRFAEGYRGHIQVHVFGLRPRPGSLGYAIRSGFDDEDHRNAVFICQEESQLPIIFQRMVDALAVTMLRFYQRNLEILLSGTRILDVIFNESPTLNDLTKLLLKFLSLAPLNWNLDPLKFSSYDHSTIRTRTLRAHKADNQVLFAMSITIAELVFP